MDYLAFLVAYKDLLDTPLIDWAFFNAFCKSKDKSEMTPEERRQKKSIS
jgi:hypothetical protein